MCGICGQFNFARDEPVEPEIVRRMTDSIAHRGPDDEGYFFSGPLGLGFRRLSIIDLAGGHQPMSDAEETVWVIFNGEIYNFKELRAELEQRGHRFRTQSDTEVIIHGYKEWGTEVFNHLNGMFGVAIWDLQRKRLVVARDAMGIKLIYYRIADGKLTFGSEIRAVLAGEQIQPEVDPVALNLFLAVPLHAFSVDACSKVSENLRRARCWFLRKENIGKSDGTITRQFPFRSRGKMKRPHRNFWNCTGEQFGGISSATCR